MVICAAGDIFQYKVDALLGDIEGVKTYIDDILVLSKEILYKHIIQLRAIFGRFQDAGLKVNFLKCSFGLKEITYLYCVITWGGIQPDPKKVEVIMDLGRPATTTEVQELIFWCSTEVYQVSFNC